MMSISPFRIIDPELVIPTSTNATGLEFWARLNDWADDRDVKVVRATLSQLELLAANPPKVSGLAVGDFWSILSKFMSRGFTPSQVHRSLDEDHLRSSYEPHLGAPDNIVRLLDDLRSVDANRRIALHGVSDSWTADHDWGCATCESNGLSHLFHAPATGSSHQALARVCRLGYLDKHPSDASRIPEFASRMFPNIEFSSGAWSQLGTLVGGPEQIVRGLIHHLGVLNDLSAVIWKRDISTQARMAALGANGVSASLEGPKTHKNRSAMKQRDFEFKNGTVRCEWHTKMKPNSNRIYFAIEGDAVLVGVIVDHLPV